MRLLKFAGSPSKNLYFTTSLRNSVQSYSLQQEKLLDPSENHPSPPSVFAISCTSHLLLSTSANPPTIFLRDLRLSTASTLLHPRCSTSAVVAADFHPEVPNIFLLAFADGTAAAYDVSCMYRSQPYGAAPGSLAGSLANGEIGYMRKLHAVGSTVSPTPSGLNSVDLALDGQTTVSSITAVALVPGYRALAVTVGADGKCCVVDFTQPTRTRALLLRTWHLRRPATSLSIVCYKSDPARGQLDGPKESHPPANENYCIAVGRQDGKVLLFDLGGKQLGAQILDPKRARVVDVEWARKEIGIALSQQTDMPASWKAPDKKECSRAGSINAQQHEEKRKAVDHQDEDLSTDFCLDRLNAFETGPTTPGAKKPAVFSAGKLEPPQTDKNHTSTEQPFHTLAPSSFKPPVPPRPVPREGGRLSMKRVQTIQEQQNEKPKPDLSTLPQRSTTTKFPASHPSNEPRIFNQRAKPPGPQSPSSNTDWKTRPRGPTKFVNESPALLEQVRDEYLYLPVPYAQKRNGAYEGADGIPSVETHGRLTPDSESIRSYKTASTHILSSESNVSDTSNDTVVDWSTGASSRRLDPSPASSHHDAQFSHFPERPRRRQAAGIEIDRNLETKDVKAPRKRKGHESVSSFVSNSSRSTILPGQQDLSALSSIVTPSSTEDDSLDRREDDPIINWRPSIALRKSPFVPNLSAGIESATATVLDSGIYTTDRDHELDKGRKQGSLTNNVSSLSLLVKESSIPPPSAQPPRNDLPGDQRPTASMNNSEDEHFMLFERLLRDEMAKLKVEIRDEFAAQREWIEGFFRNGAASLSDV